MSCICDRGPMLRRKILALRRAAFAQLALAAVVPPFVPVAAAAPLTLQVEVSDTLPGFHFRDLPRYLALHMAKARLPHWRFKPGADKNSTPDRVEWSFRLNPYAGGEVRTFVRPRMAERTFAEYRPITIEARLYLNGQYQRLIQKQVVVQGGPHDPDLAAVVASVTQSLLGPEGALRVIDAGRAPAQGPR